MKKIVFSLVTSAVFLAGCGSVSVQRNDAGSQQELSGKWNATDSRLVSKKMINSLLNGPWLDDARRAKKGKPTLIVGEFRNLSHEIISIEAFTADIERALIDSGDVQFVASTKERQQIRDERADQEFNASEATRKESGQELGADFLLSGTLNSFVDQKKGSKNIQYQIDVVLIDVKTNRKVWLDTQQHGKTVSRSSFAW